MKSDLSDTTLDAEREALLTWIETNWDELAAFAWQRYVVEGRGIVVLEGDWQGTVVVAYQTPGAAAAAGAAWPPALQDAARTYVPATDIVFLAHEHGSGTLLGMRARPPQLTPRDAGQRDGSPPLVPAA